MNISRIARSVLAAGIGCLVGVGGAFAQSSTLDDIKRRGEFRCSAPAGGNPGFFEVDDKGVWRGFEADICRALSIAMLGSDEKLQFVSVSFAQRFPALQSKDLDVVVMVSTWSLQRDTTLGLQFSNPYFFGGSQVMVNKSLNVTSIKELDGATFCVIAGTTPERALTDYMSREGLDFSVIALEKTEEARESYLSGRCDALLGWGPSMATFRQRSAKDPSEHVLLPEILLNEPIGAVVRQDDFQFLDIVNWTFAALIEAESLGVNSENVDEMKGSDNIRVQRLLGVVPGFGAALGLEDDWAYQVIKNVGNFGQIYDRTLGDGSPYKLDRGPNNLWSDGGMLFAPVID